MSQLQACVKSCLNFEIKILWWVQKYVTWECVCISKRNCEGEERVRVTVILLFPKLLWERGGQLQLGQGPGMAWDTANPSGIDSTKASGLCSHLRHNDLFSFTSAGITLQRICYGEKMEIETSPQRTHSQGSGIGSDQVKLWFGSTGVESCLELAPQREYQNL